MGFHLFPVNGRNMFVGLKNPIDEVERPIFFSVGNIVPMGRSLQKHKTNAKFPRYILLLRFLEEGEKTTKKRLKFGDKNPADLIIAYAPLAEQYEIMSWNPKAEEYEFFVVNYIAPQRDSTAGAKTAIPPARSLFRVPSEWGTDFYSLSLGRDYDEWIF